MSRTMGFAALVMLLVVSASRSQVPSKDEKPKADPPKADLVVDLSWVPAPGDRAFAYSPDGSDRFAMADMFAFQDYVKAVKAGDTAGLKDLAEKGRLVLLKSKTPILVVERHTNPYLAGGVHAIELRILDGDYKDKKAWIYEGDVCRLFERPRAVVVPRPVSKPKPIDPAVKAANSLHAGENLERRGKVDEALKVYRELAREYPGTPSAATAAGYIKAITGK